ncbi:MAG: aminotransferase class III-fold pyridoxal phosphate-dependent enzyme [Candidatus Aminicenantes bacterium]|nr:aminotransferase class III-fold pyridoxal phosphate-dependent enzyme [Candidatus Aminicenantes bacterium]
MNKKQTLQLRKQYIGPSLSLSYQEPLKIVRGFMQYLYDEKGKKYLDARNNVPHIGHCHPKVNKTAHQQMCVLNTNTRYLHDNLVLYAQRLCDKMPEPLKVCYIVNSGSEANDLALRLAWTYTKEKDVIVVDHAYHGNLSSLIHISPYKFDGKGGTGAPPYVHKVPIPDGYRGKFKYRNSQAGQKYASQIKDVLRGLKNNGKGLAAFISESIMGCAGQIVFPENYLMHAYQYVRETGGICIADEVQVGFGRMGSHFWGFETQNVVPDIVSLGKPIGNGFPLAAVVTRPEIAHSFDNGMEYFNTFGGNPVSCAVGLAVLDVIEEEGLMENARTTGAYLKDKLEQLQNKYPVIGDVRGKGLFLGIELVSDQRKLTPAAKLTAQIVEKMKEEGILIGADGPFQNVLKIKPPLVFNKDNADLFVSKLEKILEDLTNSVD